MPCHWVFCFGVKVSISVGVPPNGLGGRLSRSYTHVVVAELGFCRAAGSQTSVLF